MKLQPAMMFAPHMVLQRNKPIPIWGKSANDDEISVTLNGQTKTTIASNGVWQVEFDAMKETDKASLVISSKKTDEKIEINDVAIGEVILAGGQSNMEFLMKYDFNFEDVKKLPCDDKLRFFCYPQTSYLGFIEKESLPDWGYWRQFDSEENRGMFSAVGCYVGLALREKLNVPVGVISCNWGGTPATAWISKQDILDNPALKPVLDWQQEALNKTNWEKYIETAFLPLPIQTAEQKAFTDKFMMGVDLSELFKAGPPPMDPNIYNAYLPGPLSCIRPSGLYDMMLTKVAPYPISCVIWWQGEDDDARDWVDFYDQSMNTLIKSWRKLWNEELPFFQVELAPFRGKGPTAAKRYHDLRLKQYQATLSLDKAYDICILDAGEEYNIHPRHKKIVGDRLAKMLLQYVYEIDSKADSPILNNIERKEDELILNFDYCFGELKVKNDLKESLFVKNDNGCIDYQFIVDGERLILKGNFKDYDKLTVEYYQANYSEVCLFNSQDNPVYGFKWEA